MTCRFYDGETGSFILKAVIHFDAFPFMGGLVELFLLSSMRVLVYFETCFS